MNVIVLKCFNKMPPPPKEAIERREQAVKEVIELMGHKYCLARPMPRVR